MASLKTCAVGYMYTMNFNHLSNLTTGSYASDVIAIDDVSITDKECDTSYFMIENYADEMNNMAVDEAIESPIMYTGNSGYAYKVLVSR